MSTALVPPMESVVPKAGAAMESVMPGAAMESVMPVEPVLPDLLEDGYGDDDEAEEIGDDELHCFFAENERRVQLQKRRTIAGPRVP